MGSKVPWILSLDVGTSSVKAQGYTADGRAIRHLTASCSHAPFVTANGGSEFAPQALTQRCIHVLQQVLTQRGRLPLPEAVAISVFWHSLVGVNSFGEAITPVYTWADTRSAHHVKLLVERISASQLHQETGCFAHTSYLPARLLWLHDTCPDIVAQVRYWLSFADYLYLQLFGEAVTSHSMASGSGLYHQAQQQWSAKLCAVARINIRQLPQILADGVSLRGLRPPYARQLPQLAATPWFPAYGDGACSNVGSGCAMPQKIALMIGTSGAMRSIRTDPEYTPQNGLWCYRLDQTRYITGGALSNGGNALNWCKQTFRLPDPHQLQEQLSQLQPCRHGLDVLPFLAGERATGWAAHAQAAIQGLGLHTTPIQIYQAFMEAVCLRFKAIYKQFELQTTATAVVATGGALLHSPVWMQMMADVLEIPVIASEERQASCRGAALLAAERLGLINHIGEAAELYGKSYLPRPQVSIVYQEAFARQIALYGKLIGPSPDLA
ncbi:MAG TPA: gluconokinase [Firmicutes bacterium]|nr:gluconokinase [Bacillota bacterium]